MEDTISDRRSTARPFSLFKPRAERTISDHLRNYLFELLAIALWLYASIKVFVFDFDTTLINQYLPDQAWLLDFKLLFVLALSLILWLWVGTRDAVLWLLYTALYIPILLIIKLPLFVFRKKDWVLAISFLNALINFFTNLRYRLFFLTAFLFALATIVFAKPNALVATSTAVLVMLILATYVRTFIDAFRPSKIFRSYSQFLSRTREVWQRTFLLDEEIRELPTERLGPHQLKQWRTNLQTSVFTNRLFLFFAKKLRQYQRSEWRILASVFSLLALIAFLILSFSIVHYALYKIDSDLFLYTKDPTWFTFLFYSFNNFVLNSTSGFEAIMPLSQAAYMLQAFLSIILALLAVTLIVSYRARKASAELDELISQVETEGKAIEVFIQTEYKVPSMEQAIEKLRELEADLVKAILWLSKDIR